MKQGNEYTIGQALRYKQSADKEAIARFVFRVHITNIDYGAELVGIDYDDPTDISGTSCLYDKIEITNDKVYNLQGREVVAPSRHGLYIVNGKKIKL